MHRRTNRRPNKQDRAKKPWLFREEDFVTADEALRMLKLGQNRNRLFMLLKAHKIESQTFNGVKIGYRREEIHKLGERLAKSK